VVHSFLAWLIAATWGWLGVSAAPAAPASQPSSSAPPQRDLLAQCGDNRFWIAHVIPAGTAGINYDRTDLNWRDDIGGSWRSLPTISARVDSMTSDGNELLLALHSGQWMIADDSTIRLGSPPPHNARMIALASERTIVWAIVEESVPAGGPPTRPLSPPTTRAAVSVDIPSIGPLPHQLTAYRLSLGKWIDPQPLPPGLTDQSLLSMAVIDGRPLLGWKDAEGTVFITRLTESRGWSAPLTRSAPATADFKLLIAQDQPVLWTSAPGRAGQLCFGGDFSRVVPLTISGAAPPADAPKTFVLAFGYFRWLAFANDQLFEQRYELDGRPHDRMTAIGGGASVTVPLRRYATASIIVVLIAAIAAIAQRRAGARQGPRGSPGRLRIAPLGVRAAAGLVDLVPALTTLGAAPRTVADASVVDPATLLNIAALAAVTYVAHTLIAEMICGQTIGKMMFGLRVLAANGRRARPVSLAIRNLLRIVELCLIVPLFWTLLSPRRQRLGDLMANTIVTADEPESPSDQQA